MPVNHCINEYEPVFQYDTVVLMISGIVGPEASEREHE